MNTALILIPLIIAIIVMAYELHQSVLPQYRKGCNECDAARRRAEEAQAEVNHKYHHDNGFGNCPDERCSRNTPKAE